MQRTSKHTTRWREQKRWIHQIVLLRLLHRQKNLWIEDPLMSVLYKTSIGYGWYHQWVWRVCGCKSIRFFTHIYNLNLCHGGRLSSDLFHSKSTQIDAFILDFRFESTEFIGYFLNFYFSLEWNCAYSPSSSPNLLQICLHSLPDKLWTLGKNY